MRKSPSIPPLAIGAVVALAACADGPAFDAADAARSDDATDSGIERLDASGLTIGELETGIAEILESARLPGLQVAVVSDGDVVYTSGFGVKSTETGDPVTPRTVFAANSFSKTMFAYLVLQLIDEGVLDLDSPLVSYLPKPIGEYEFYTDLAGEERAGRLTPRMVLSHTTGFPNWRWFTQEGTLHFIYEPEERHGYSGEGIFLLQLVVEEVTGQNVEELAQSRIFDPFGMTRTSFLSLPAFDDDYAVDHDHYLNPLGKQKRDEANAAGSAQTTAADYGRFLVAVMAGEGLSAEAREAVFSPQVTIEHARMFGPLSQTPRSPDAPTAGWGLGWGLVESDYGWAFFHTGNDEGAANYHVGFPDRGIAVVLNGNSQNLETAAPALTRLIIGDVYSPFEFLGYEPFESARHRLVDAIASEGVEEGLRWLASLDADEIRRWYPAEWALLDAAGQDLIGLERYSEAGDLYRHFVTQYPERLFGNDRLGSALTVSNRFEEARSAYEVGQSLARDNAYWSRLYGWKLEWIRALLDPHVVATALLVEYTGDYGARHVELRGEALFYHRAGTANPEPRELFALSEDTFVMKENDSFRLRFDRGENGRVFRVTGLYLDTDPDETLRDPY